MISEPLKFVALGEGEQAAGTWEVVSILPRVTLGRIVAFVGLAGTAFGFALLGIGAWKLAAAVPAVLAPLAFVMSDEKGYLLLTDRRLIHYHRESGLWRNSHRTSEVPLADISGLRAEIETTWGLTTAKLFVMSMYHDDVVVQTFTSSIPFLAWIPGIGRMFKDSNMGRDAVEAIRDLYAKVRAARAGGTR
jgi:hypothetical protein